jgi:hypothetical protein
MRGGVVDELPEIGPHSRFATADVHVEHLHAHQLVDDVHALAGGQLTGIALSRRGEAVHTRQVAGVRELPGQTDRRVEAALELVHQSWDGSCGVHSGHGVSLQTNILDFTSTPRRADKRLLLVVDACRPQGRPGIRLLGQRIDHVDDGPVLQERKLSGAKVIQQSPERFRPHRHLVMEPPAEVGIERHSVVRGGRPRLRSGHGHGQ